MKSILAKSQKPKANSQQSSNERSDSQFPIKIRRDPLNLLNPCLADRQARSITPSTSKVNSQLSSIHHPKQTLQSTIPTALTYFLSRETLLAYRGTLCGFHKSK
ncbi:MAG: hypothetical protein ACSHXL_03235 [Bacteroidota bacterium]